MCGIVGMVGEITPKFEKVFENLLYMDVLRGFDSTGIVAVSVTGKVSTAKALGTPCQLLDSKKYEAAMRYNNIALIGHNRWATKGKVTAYNAHPFSHGAITGVHNGTLTNQALLPDFTDFEVDSENIIYAIDKTDIFETVSKLNGAYTLVYHDAEDSTINFVRNKERPLWMCGVEGHNITCFASEPWMLRGALNRNGFTVNKLREVPIDVLHYFTISDKDSEFTPDDIQTEEVTPYVAPVSNNVSYEPPQERDLFVVERITGNYALLSYEDLPEKGISACMYLTERNRKDLEQALETGDLVEAGGRFMVWDKALQKSLLSLNGAYHIIALEEEEEEGDTVPDYRGKPLNEEDFLHATKQGCAWCSQITSWDDREEILFISDDEHVCGSCKSLPDIQLYLA